MSSVETVRAIEGALQLWIKQNFEGCARVEVRCMQEPTTYRRVYHVGLREGREMLFIDRVEICETVVAQINGLALAEEITYSIMRQLLPALIMLAATKRLKHDK